MLYATIYVRVVNHTTKVLYQTELFYLESDENFLPQSVLSSIGKKTAVDSNILLLTESNKNLHVNKKSILEIEGVTIFQRSKIGIGFFQ